MRALPRIPPAVGDRALRCHEHAAEDGPVDADAERDRRGRGQQGADLERTLEIASRLDRVPAVVADHVRRHALQRQDAAEHAAGRLGDLRPARSPAAPSSRGRCCRTRAMCRPTAGRARPRARRACAASECAADPGRSASTSSDRCSRSVSSQRVPHSRWSTPMSARSAAPRFARRTCSRAAPRERCAVMTRRTQILCALGVAARPEHVLHGAGREHRHGAGQRQRRDLEDALIRIAGRVLEHPDVLRAGCGLAVVDERREAALRAGDRSRRHARVKARSTSGLGFARPDARRLAPRRRLRQRQPLLPDEPVRCRLGCASAVRQGRAWTAPTRAPSI